MEGTSEPTQSVYADDLYCPECGYNLRGLTSRRCPECGLKLDFIESEVSLIPWERRHEIGRLRAYWQTVRLVVFRNKLFCRAVYRPVSYRDAQSFRWVSILHVYIPVLLTLAAVHFRYPHLLPLAADETGVWFIVLVCACFLLALLAFTGLPSYFFHPSYLSMDQQNRAMTLSYYGCSSPALTPLPFVALCTAMLAAWIDNQLAALLGLAALFILILGFTALLVSRPFSLHSYLYRRAALALIPLAVIMLCAGWVGLGEPPSDLAFLLGVPSAVVPLGLVLLYWFDLIAIARRTLRRPWPVWRLVFLLPLLWLICGGLIVIVPPAAAYFLALVFYSLRTGGLGG